MKTYQYHYSLSRPCSCIRTHRLNDGETYDEGIVETKYGSVSVYMQGDDKYNKISRMDINVNGIVFVKQFDKRYTKRGIVTKANQFAKEMHNP